MKKSLSLVKVSFCRALLWNSCTYRPLVRQPSVRIIGGIGGFTYLYVFPIPYVQLAKKLLFA
jgi:hypothetical protein